MKTKLMALLATSLLSVSAFAAAGAAWCTKANDCCPGGSCCKPAAACCHQNPSCCSGGDCCGKK